ncbi:hypothetical protein TNCV_1357391 [Trichonephila clavipes]|uniref:Uncharacterized protein n=1 Tax=Trichonephila clavipes TaxID=2585209 RepID=A0A8X6VHU3_TRICX|nr:hypothetical protein TNCV_1357391 [Trichonephila clavipes]
MGYHWMTTPESSTANTDCPSSNTTITISMELHITNNLNYTTSTTSNGIQKWKASSAKYSQSPLKLGETYGSSPEYFGRTLPNQQCRLKLMLGSECRRSTCPLGTGGSKEGNLDQLTNETKV